MATFAFAASPVPDEHCAFNWTASCAGPVERPRTSGKPGSPYVSPIFTRSTSPLRGSVSGRSPRNFSFDRPASVPSVANAEGSLLPPLPLAACGADAFGLGQGTAHDELRPEDFPDQFSVEGQCDSGSSYQSCSTVRSSGSPAFNGALGLVGPTFSSMSLSSDLSLPSLPELRSPANECRDSITPLTPRLMGEPGNSKAGALAAAPATDLFGHEDDLHAFLQSLPAWVGTSASTTKREFRPTDDSVSWQDLEDSVRIEPGSCPTTPRAGHAGLRATPLLSRAVPGPLTEPHPTSFSSQATADDEHPQPWLG